jgi:hypothetical protein
VGNRTRRTVIAASALALGFAAAGLTATAADAAVTPNTLPHGCGYTQPNTWEATTTCAYGPGHQRADITCTDGITGNTMTEYGPWVWWYQNSTASCGDGSRYTVTWVTAQVSS